MHGYTKWNVIILRGRWFVSFLTFSLSKSCFASCWRRVLVHVAQSYLIFDNSDYVILDRPRSLVLRFRCIDELLVSFLFHRPSLHFAAHPFITRTLTPISRRPRNGFSTYTSATTPLRLENANDVYSRTRNFKRSIFLDTNYSTWDDS